MKFLVINPNTSQFVTDKVCQTALDAVGSAVEVVGVTGRAGAPIVGTRSECAFAAQEALALAAEHADGCDGVLLAISFDTGLDALREMLAIPVVGMSEAGMSAAMSVSRKFSMVTFGNRAAPLYQELVEHYGWASRCAGVVSLPPLSQAELEDTKRVMPKLIEAIEQAAHQDRAEAMVLAGAVFAGIADDIRDQVSIPVVDGIVAGIHQLKTLNALNLCKPKAGSLAFPPAKTLFGMSPALTKTFQTFADTPKKK
jgi:allantoin racemase